MNLISDQSFEMKMPKLIYQTVRYSALFFACFRLDLGRWDSRDYFLANLYDLNWGSDTPLVVKVFASLRLNFEKLLQVSKIALSLSKEVEFADKEVGISKNYMKWGKLPKFFVKHFFFLVWIAKFIFWFTIGLLDVARYSNLNTWICLSHICAGAFFFCAATYEDIYKET